VKLIALSIQPVALLVTALLPLRAAGASGARTSDRAATPVVTSGHEPFEGEEVVPDYDPWQPFNERTFKFNHDILDRWALKPLAICWNKVAPDPAKRALARAFDNLDAPRRIVNNLLQLCPEDAGGELARFVVNTTVGVVGFIDVAGMVLHLEQKNADMGQTLGVYGVGAGPYLVLPFFAPLTVRDGIGLGVDYALDPFSYFIPRVIGVPLSAARTVNERSLNLLVFQDAEESVLDLYSAVRNAYLQRRRSIIESRRAICRHRVAVLVRADATGP
jgi:phospholipid-binding lipoprotein MlaA